MITITDSDILGLIDVQPTFMPGGELARCGRVTPSSRSSTGCWRARFSTPSRRRTGTRRATRPLPARIRAGMPFDVVDMAYGPQTLWPDHAVIGSPGAELHPGLDPGRIELILRKGFRPGIDSYSAFRENDRRTGTGLDGWLRARGVSRVFLAGLATDYCVAWSAEDAADYGFEVVLIEDACRGIGAPPCRGGLLVGYGADATA